MQLLQWNLGQVCFANIDIRYEYLRISFIHIVLNKYSDDKNSQHLLLHAERPYTINSNCKFTDHNVFIFWVYDYNCYFKQTMLTIT